MFKKRVKRADVLPGTFLAIFWTIMAVLVLVALPSYALGKGKSTQLEKAYLARDIAMLIDAIYASPGDIRYVYPLDIPKYGFDVAFSDSDNTVRVYEKGNPAAAVTFPFLDAKHIDFSYREVKLEKDEKLIFIKENSGIRVTTDKEEAEKAKADAENVK